MHENNSASDRTRNQGESIGENTGSDNTLLSQGKTMFEEHKGKLAIGVAATLGVMIFYNWVEKQLAKEDPESHARLKRLKAVVRSGEINAQDMKNEDCDEPDTAVASQRMNCKGSDGISAPR